MPKKNSTNTKQPGLVIVGQPDPANTLTLRDLEYFDRLARGEIKPDPVDYSINTKPRAENTLESVKATTPALAATYVPVIPAGVWTPLEKKILAALHYRAKMTKDLQDEICESCDPPISSEAVVAALRNGQPLRSIVENRAGVGYYRKDALPK